jgi:hypothetical protein
LWIRIRIGSGFNDLEDPDPDSESGSMGKENEEKMHFSLTFKTFLELKGNIVQTASNFDFYIDFVFKSSFVDLDPH